MKLSKAAVFLAIASLAVSVPMVDAGHGKKSKNKTGGSKKKGTGGSNKPESDDAGNRVPTCTDCTNLATPVMQDKGKSCANLYYISTNKKCSEKTSFWQDNKWCQYTCYKLGQGYDGDKCCDQIWTPKPTKAPTEAPTKSPTKAPTPEVIDPDSCIAGCTNKASPEMIASGRTCKNWSTTEDYCYEKPLDWRYYQYCSRTCSKLGYPYGGARCCTADDINRAGDDYPQLAFGSDSDELLADCRGDCDSTDDCESGLVCYQRSGFDAMPGCKGEPHYDTDYCVDPTRNFNELVFLGQKGPFGRCAGDCDTDYDCVGSLRCFQRDGEVNNVPGCPGRAVDNVDYCYEAS